MTDLEQLTGLTIYPRSVVEVHDVTYFLARTTEGKRLGIVGDGQGFQGQRSPKGDALLCPLTPSNAARLREKLPRLRPQPLGLQTSAGCGDRVGLATPGHVRAVRHVGGIAPIFAQQSMRENARTVRTPQEVFDDAMWGVFQEGWHDPWGADADHLKTTFDVDLCMAAGYTFYTVDPGDHVDNAAHTAPLDALREKLRTLPWDALEDSPTDLRTRYLGHTFAVESLTLEFDETSLLRAACKYGRAIAHSALMYHHLAAAMGARPFELEVSVDETDTPTSALEHYFIAAELKRLAVSWVSLAPRYVGRFEKGVDYIGDLDTFDVEIAAHAAIARVMGPYKLSLHSGSDKFSIYPIVARHANDLVHLKTAGTSYLEALRVIAGANPDLFRAIMALALERYDEDRATYHTSADPAKVPTPDTLSDDDLPGVLNQFDGRQVLHMTFGSALTRFGEQIKNTLDAHEEAYSAALEAHFIRHLEPFS